MWRKCAEKSASIVFDERAVCNAIVYPSWVCYTSSVNAFLSNSVGRKEGSTMQLTEFFMTVMASVVAYIVCKWLDGIM